MRTPDAVHLASALVLGAALGWFVSHDRRLIDAAEQIGLPICTPGVRGAVEPFAEDQTPA